MNNPNLKSIKLSINQKPKLTNSNHTSGASSKLTGGSAKAARMRAEEAKKKKKKKEEDELFVGLRKKELSFYDQMELYLNPQSELAVLIN